MPFWRGFLVSSVLLLSFSSQLGAEPYLWLPKSYKDQLPALKKAALIAADNPRCEQVLKGSVNIDLSSHELPVFKILCRDKNRKTFSLLLDGVDFLAYDRSRSRYHQGPSERSMREYWDNCNKAVAGMYEDFRTIKILTKSRPEPVLYKDATVGITIDFDAISLIGEPLAFRAECVFSSGTSYRLKLSGREQ